MPAPSESEARSRILALVREWFGVPKLRGRNRRARDSSGVPDWIISVPGHTLVVEYKSRGAVPLVAGAAERVRECARRRGGVPVVAVPYMGEAGRQLCAREDVCWLDLSGNAHLVARGLRIEISGRPNAYRERGRPGSVFAPKSSRVARCLLVRYPRALTQRELAREVALDEGYVSRIVRRLEGERLIVREKSGAVRPRDPELLLEAWREVYDFRRHRILPVHRAARSGDDLVREASSALSRLGIPHAATGLGAAWLHTRFADFRTASFYVRRPPEAGDLRRQGIREETEAPNLWLVVPKDEGVFWEAHPRDGVPCVHPVQAYLDLKGHPERAPEAALRLREALLTWRRDGR